jgi:hypothetical protein
MVHCAVRPLGFRSSSIKRAALCANGGARGSANCAVHESVGLRVSVRCIRLADTTSRRRLLSTQGHDRCISKIRLLSNLPGLAGDSGGGRVIKLRKSSTLALRNTEGADRRHKIVKCRTPDFLTAEDRNEKTLWTSLAQLGLGICLSLSVVFGDPSVASAAPLSRGADLHRQGTIDPKGKSVPAVCDVLGSGFVHAPLAMVRLQLLG